MSTLLLLLALALPAQSTGQLITHKIESAVLEETRRVLVQLPDNYGEGGARYPVVYLLDGNLMIHSAPGKPNHAEIVRRIVKDGSIPEVIVVGVMNTDRARDMTPTHLSERPTSGGAEDFLRFLSDELIPFIDHEYRTTPTRILYGHSLAGLFTTHVVISLPRLFAGYIASSPALSWDGGEILTRARRAFSSEWTGPVVLYFGIGEGDEYEAFVSGTRRFENLLGELRPPALTWRCVILPGEDHASAVPINLRDGLIYLFGDGGLSENMQTTARSRMYTRVKPRVGSEHDERACHLHQKELRPTGSVLGEAPF